MIAGRKLNMVKIGKKTKDWLKAKPKLIEEYKEKKITACENCGSRFFMSLHHRPKRSTQNAKHDYEHTRLLCGKCHNWFEYHEEDDKKLFSKKRGYNPKDKIKVGNNKSKKANWEIEHKCKHCKQIISLLLCPHCKKISV